MTAPTFADRVFRIAEELMNKIEASAPDNMQSRIPYVRDAVASKCEEIIKKSGERWIPGEHVLWCEMEDKVIANEIIPVARAAFM
jgi:hypothetical protein